jgi:ferredoxin
MSEPVGPNLGRRGFFRDAMRRAVGPLAEYLEDRVPSLAEAAKPSRHPPLRPPGAVAESALLDTCFRCGACVATCPAKAIVPMPAGAGRAARTPMVDPDNAACVVCEGLLCTHVCPSGALQPLTDRYAIDMGLAEVYGGMCVRSRGDECVECVDKCPVAKVAIRFNDEGPPEVLEGCVGCGVCQLYCPTTPKAIVVKPRT